MDEEFIDFLSKYEDFRANAYYDPIGEVWTIGYGTTRYPNGEVVSKGDIIDKDTAKRYMLQYLKDNEPVFSKYFVNWEHLPSLTKYAIMSMAYRGGANNFGIKSPKFTKAVNEAFEDGVVTTDEYRNIASQLSIENGKTDNLSDRKERTFALLGGMYNWDDNKSINTATTVRSPYFNYHNNVFYPGNKWNTKWELFQKANESNPNFIQRLKDPTREVINLDDGTIATHKMAYSTTDDGYDIVYPEILEELVYPEFDLFHWFTPTKKLVDKSSNRDQAFKDAVLSGDTIHVPAGYGEYFTTTYKQHYPAFNKNGGAMNYLDYLKQGSSIHIKPENKGKFTKAAKEAGETPLQHAHNVLKNPNATALQKKRALFVVNARKFKH